MTVKELTEQLAKYPPDMRVMVNGYEFGYDDLEELNTEDVALNVHTNWYGGLHGDANEYPDSPAVPCIILPRPTHNMSQ